MESVVKVAAYICKRYQDEFGRLIDEMKLHKLLYFTQRESIIQNSEPMFPEQFLAWKYGPVMLNIRELYAANQLTTMPSEQFINNNKSVFDYVFKNYAPKDSWSLSLLSHGELSWKNARKNLAINQNGSEYLKIGDIRKDAERIKMRRFLLEKIAYNK